MKFANPYWSNKLRISALQRWIIVHSMLYYELSNSIIEDAVFDRNARQLVEMQDSYPDEAEESDYWYVFYDFDASTGFNLYDRLDAHDKEYLMLIAQHVLRVYKAGGANNVIKVKKKAKRRASRKASS